MAQRGNTTPVQRLRGLVQDCLSKNMTSSAVFFADKLIAMTDKSPEEVLSLARIFFRLREYRRAYHLLNSCGLAQPTSAIQFRYLAAKCKAETAEWNECLYLIGEDTVVPGDGEGGDVSMEGSASTGAAGGDEIKMGAAVYLLRGQVCEALSNNSKAVQWYREALKVDAACYEAFERLVDNHMLERNEEEELLGQLRFGDDDLWLRELYQNKLRKYENAGKVEDNFVSLESDYGLGSSTDIMSVKADLLYYRNDFKGCYDQTKLVLETDPFHHACLPVHIAALVELKLKSELYKLSHDLADEYPDSAVAWYSVGSYYYLTKKYEKARRYYSKATSLDKRFVHAWLGYGHAFAAQDESDQAMAAYRTAARLVTGCHLPHLFIGMEYLRTSNLPIAELLFSRALSISSNDPLVYNELGVVSYRDKDYAGAANFFMQALDRVPENNNMEIWEPTLYNLGHSLRKLRDYQRAIQYYTMALSMSPRNGSIYSALGFTHHLMGDLELAIEYYHKALGIRSDDTITSDLLEKALEEATQTIAI